jgi:RNA polymerase sigma factor (TIGR02999 family)
MAQDNTRQITLMLDQINGGREGAFTELVGAVYADLKRISANAMVKTFDRPLDGLTRPPTEIAHDAIIELRRQNAEWINREQFFAIATTLIFRLVKQYRRARSAKKRGGGDRGAHIGSFDDSGNFEPAAPDALVEDKSEQGGALAALERLHAVYPRQAEVLTLTTICNHTQEVAAGMIGISVPQLQRDVRFAKAWLKDAMADHTQ